MGIAENKSMARRYIKDFWAAGNLEVASEIVSESFLFHSPLRELEGREAIKQFVLAIHSVFSGLEFEIKDLIAEGEKVVIHWTMTGIHSNEFMGIAATGRSISIPGASIVHISGEKVTEAWLHWDRMSLMEQLKSEPTDG